MSLPDEEWDFGSLILGSDIICSDCGEELLLTDEVFLLQVVLPSFDENGNQQSYILQEGDGYKYEPQFFHLMCWEELWDSFMGHTHDLPTIPDTYENAITECYACGSQVLPGEVSGMLSLGEIRCSRRMPDGEKTNYFDGCNTKPQLLCIACLYVFNQDLFEMWDDLEYGGVCEEGLQQRCWRDGGCSYGCRIALGAAE